MTKKWAEFSAKSRSKIGGGGGYKSSGAEQNRFIKKQNVPDPIT